jgi:Suppressor of fused protein (SUFU)
VAAVEDRLQFVEARLRTHFQSEPLRASVSFVGVDPIEVLCFAESGRTYLATVGMSRSLMSDPASPFVESDAPSAELVLTVHDHQREVWRRLAVIAASPAVEGAVLSAGSRFDMTEPWLPGSRCTGAVFDQSSVGSLSFDGGSMVEFLQVLPATATELAWARVHGSADLQQIWADQQTDLADLYRGQAELSR